MSKIMQNLVFLVEPSHRPHETPLKAGNMLLNRFSIDEVAAFELSGLHFLEDASRDILYEFDPQSELKRKEKGKEFSF